MRARICCVALAVALMPAAASAQDGLRSASLPERTLGPSPPPMHEDVFRARPGRIARIRTAHCCRCSVLRPSRCIHTCSRSSWCRCPAKPLNRRASRRRAPSGAIHHRVPGRPKTFYMIPGCTSAIAGPSPSRSLPAAVFPPSHRPAVVTDEGGYRSALYVSRVTSLSVALKHASFDLSDGSTLAYTLRAAPKTAAPRIALIHSLALDRSVWDGVIERLDDADVLPTTAAAMALRSPGRAHSRRNSLRATSPSCSTTSAGSRRRSPAARWGAAWRWRLAGFIRSAATALGLIDTTAWYGPEAAENLQGARGCRARQGHGRALRFSVDPLVLRRVPRQHPRC